MNIYQLIGEIMALATIINSNTKSNVFTRFFGHVNIVVIEIFLHGWEKGKDNDIYEELYIDKPDSFKKLNLIKQQLLKIVLENKIDTSKLSYSVETEQIKKYRLLKEAI